MNWWPIVNMSSLNIDYNIYTYPRLHYFEHNVLQCDECWERYWDRPATPLCFDHLKKHTLFHIWIGLFFYHLQLMLQWDLFWDLDASAKLSYLAPRFLQKIKSIPLLFPHTFIIYTFPVYFFSYILQRFQMKLYLLFDMKCINRCSWSMTTCYVCKAFFSEYNTPNCSACRKCVNVTCASSCVSIAYCLSICFILKEHLL